MRKAWPARLKDASTAAIAAALALGVAPPPRANAADGREIGAAILAGGSTCPAPTAVWAELETLVPPQRLAAGVRARAGPLTIVDQGAVYRVEAADGAREYHDEARDCAQRARVAAIFLALTLEPAETVPEERPPLPPAAPPSVADARVLLDLGARFDAGLGPSPPDLAGGLALRLGLGGGAVLITAGAAFLLPREFTIGGVRLRQWRVPVDLALRARRTGTPFSPFGEVGVVVALLSERAVELATPRTARAVELGLRAAVGVRGTWSARLAPFAALHAEMIPIPPAIVALPRGSVGHTPYVWLGATAGLSWGLR